MSHRTSESDRAFQAAFEAGAVPPEAFDHRAHVRLAFVYLVDGDLDAARERMQHALLNFLHRHGNETAKYHETLTRAWFMAVRHFLQRSPGCDSFDAFIALNPMLLDSQIMLTHYSAATLFSDEARQKYVEPDVSPIPPHGAGIAQE